MFSLNVFSVAFSCFWVIFNHSMCFKPDFGCLKRFISRQFYSLLTIVVRALSVFLVPLVVLASPFD